MKRSRSIWLGAVAMALGCLLKIQAQGSAADYFHRGFEKEQKRDFDGALADFNRAIALEPDYAEALNGRGFVKHAKGDLDGALADYTRAIAADPRHIMAYNNRGNIKRLKGDLTGAVADFDQAIKLKPNYANALVNRGAARTEQGDFDRAITDDNRAIAAKPDHAIAYNNRGNARAAKGDFAGAVADFTLSLQFDPAATHVYGSRGTARNAQGDFEGALADYSTGIQLAKDDAAHAWFYRYLTLRRMHRETAVSELSAASVKWKDRWAKAIEAYLTGEVDEAAFFAEAEARSRVSEADYFVGMVHLLRDEPAEAREFFERCAAIATPTDTSGGLARAELTRLARGP